MQTTFKVSLKYLEALLRWTVLSIIIGAIGGVLGSIFHICIDKVTELRQIHGWILYLLPIGGLAIMGMYHLFVSKGQIDTNRVIESVREKKDVPLIMVPLIFISTVITHLLGGSAGREGAALQLGGSIGYNVGKVLKLDKKSMHIIVMSGMASVFSALFGTPITAAIFSIEVACVGVFHYAGLVPCVISSVSAYMISKLFGLSGVSFLGILPPDFGAYTFIKIGVLAVLCALVSILFCMVIKKSEKIMDKAFHNKYLRAFIGGAIIVVLTLLVNTRDYNGAGMEVITRALSGEAKVEAFLLKIIFTAITIAAGFKGGEIVPAFFIGSTFGCTLAGVLGLDASFGAAIGFICLFCGVVNCPLASLILSVEVFGTEGLLFFALACSISYLMSGSFGLYHSQKLMYSKLDDEYIDTYTK